ncbi:MAG: hypothetical protein C0399_07360 [Syntrophus sp. (in: bacteria)]|nr:hypothetical protein [Syntrophus sp. (in: bacteria)]
MRSSVVKIKKEESMKKLVIIALALLLALPVVGFAGSATSRWDMTIGGYVKMDMGWSDQSGGPDQTRAFKKSNAATRPNVNDEYGTMFMTAQESRLNFLVKGPDAWGAKTSAFMEFDFRGWGNTDRGGANIRHAFLKFDWARDSLLIGRFWLPEGTPTPFMLGIGDLPEAKMGRSEQITWTHKFGKTFTSQLGLVNSARTYNGIGTTDEQVVAGVASRSRSMAPMLAGDFNFKSDACGKIGANMLTFGFNGLYGYTKETWQRTVNDAGVAYQATRKYDDANVRAYKINIYTFIPIIPERNANKANALSVSGGAQMFSNLSNEVTWGPQGASPSSVYPRFDGAMEQAPTYFSAWGALSYNFTHAFQGNLIYGHTHATNVSNAWKRAYPDQIVSNNVYMVTLGYDVSPAIKLGAEFSHYFTKYGNDSAALALAGGSNTGSANIGRLAAYYFF